MLKRHNTLGKYLGNYHLRTELAASSSSRIFLGESQTATNQFVAVKWLHSLSLNSQQDEESFLQEVSFLKQLRHPYILPILDAGLDKGIPYIVSEYAPNGSLQEYLRRLSSTIPQHEMMTIISQIGQALQYAHQHNVIHCNLKPQNILFNEKGHAVLADFHLASLQTTLSHSHINSSGASAYIAPEQLKGTISKGIDQFAIGCIAYEMLTGRAPLTKPHLGKLGQYTTQTLNKIPRLKSHTSRDFLQAICKAIAYDPLQRYHDIQEFLAALDEINQRDHSEKAMEVYPLLPEEAATTTPITTYQDTPILAETTLAASTAAKQEDQSSEDQVFSAPPSDSETFDPNAITTSIPLTGHSKHTRMADRHSSSGERKRGKDHLKQHPQGNQKREQFLILASSIIVTLSIIGTLIFSFLPMHIKGNTSLSITPTQGIASTPTQEVPTVVVTSTPTEIPTPQVVAQRLTPTPTSVPTSLPTPTPTPSPVSSNGWTVSPGYFKLTSCQLKKGHFTCRATLSQAANAAGLRFWSTSSSGAATTFTPSSGSISPGQTISITISVATSCQANESGTFVFSGFNTTITVPWNC